MFKINECSKLMSQLKKKLDICFFIHMRNRVSHPQNVDKYYLHIRYDLTAK